MDLRLFHPGERPEANYRMLDKLNGKTGLLACRFLEWTGWYNYRVSQRLLGHYRLYQHFKKNYKCLPGDLPVVQAYILNYRALHGLKYFFARTMCHIYSLGTWNDHYMVATVAGINRILVNESTGILQEFLTGADADPTAALALAIQKINDPAFLDRTDRPINLSLAQSYQSYESYQSYQSYEFNHSEVNTQTTHNHEHKNEYVANHIVNDQSRSVAFNPIIMQPITKEGAKGKEAGVFSKKQILIFFDLLSESSKLEKIDFKKTNKYETISLLFHAITGKSKDSFIEEMSNFRSKDLYHFNTEGELGQLVSTLTNLADIFRSAGFRSVSELADRKIKQLEQKRKRD